MNYPRRQQYRRLRRAVAAAAASLAAVWLALLAASEGSLPAAASLLVAAIALAGYAYHHTRLAGRSRVGARSEEEVQRALAPLQAEGWRLRHSLRWRGRGDIDSVAIAPTGIAFTIETKTRNYESQHIARAREMAVWMRTRQRRWCCGGALPVLCIVRACQLEHIEADVLIVSLDRLPAALRTAAGARPRPTFLSPTRPGR